MHTFWQQCCTKMYNLISMPIADDEMRDSFGSKAYISDNILSNPPCIVVFAYEAYCKDDQSLLLIFSHRGPIYSANNDSNIIDPCKAVVHLPFAPYLAEAVRENWGIINICLPYRKWELKQTSTGSTDELSILNEFIIWVWDYYLALGETQKIFFISSGISSYAICHMISKRVVQFKLRGVIFISPTLYLPVSSAEKAEWYQKNSLVVIPTKKPDGTAIPTASSFGSCISSGIEDPQETSLVIERSKERIFKFIRDRLHDDIAAKVSKTE